MNTETTTQRIYLVRHGIAKHNLISNRHQLRINRSFIDPPLVPEGVAKLQQSTQLQELSKKEEHIDLIVVSPLTRCIETAYIVFQKPNTKIISKEELREAFGIYYSDQRSSYSELKERFPSIEFDTENEPDLDLKWKSNKRETISEITTRITTFFQWLSHRKERNIVIFTHGVFMECAFNYYFPGALLDRRVHNGDLYCANLKSHPSGISFLDNLYLVPPK